MPRTLLTAEEKAERLAIQRKNQKENYRNDPEIRKRKQERYLAKKAELKAYNNKRYHDRKAELEELRKLKREVENKGTSD